MNPRRVATRAVTSNPVLIGAVTVLVVVIAVFLSYNANQGLPFVPSKEIRIELANGANLLTSGEVKVGGQRVGVVSEMRPKRLDSGRVGAELTVKIDEKASDIPVDSTWRVRPRSPLGLKYIELTRGTSTQIIGNGDLVPVSRTSASEELVDYQSIFDKDTRDGVRKVTEEAGNALALRGVDLNRAIADAPRLLRHLEPVSRSLAAPGTRLRRLTKELADGARIVEPVREQFARGFTRGAATFEAWSRDEQAVTDSINLSPPALEAAIPSLRAQRPALAALEDTSRSLRRLAAVVPEAAPPLTAALTDGLAGLRRSPETSGRLETNVQALGELVRDPATSATFVALGRLGEVARPLTRHVGPYVTVCNYFNYAVTHLGEHLTEPDATGGMQRTLFMLGSRNVNPTSPNPGTLGASRPANGEPVLTGAPINAHSQAYSAAISATGEADCEGGQRGYMERLNAFAPADLKTVRDAHTPGNQGPTYTGRARVPEGQTFDRNPTLGPQLLPQVDNP